MGIQVDDHVFTCRSPGLFARTPGRGWVRRLDVIGQGREPERDFRLRVSLSRRWRIGIGAAAVAVVAVLAVACFLLRHAAGTPGATVAPEAPPISRVLTQIPPRGGKPTFFICAPSTSACSVRINVISGNASRIVRPGHRRG
jgi:hypothetical protein